MTTKQRSRWRHCVRCLRFRNLVHLLGYGEGHYECADVEACQQAAKRLPSWLN